MAITTRRATPDDAEAVALAHVRGWQVNYRGVIPDSYLDSMDVVERTALWRGFLAEETPTDYVVERDGAVVGFVNVGPYRADAAAPGCGEIWAMYVHPDHWGCGAGYALMQRAIAHLGEAGLATGFLWVLEENPRARRFYERQGWSADQQTQVESIGGVDIVERRYSISPD